MSNRTFNNEAKIKLTQLINEGLSVTQEIETLIFVDTPESNFVSIEHPDLFSNPYLDLSAFSNMIYFIFKSFKIFLYVSNWYLINFIKYLFF